jgi:hypothetical protein
MGGANSTHGEYEHAYTILIKNLKRKGHWEDPHVDGRVILRCMPI